MNQKKGYDWKRPLLILIAIVLGVIIYAYGFEVTNVNLSAMKEPQRQTNFVRILRALARPDFFRFEQEEFVVRQPIYIDCPAGEFTLPEPDRSVPYLEISPPCAPPRGEVTIIGRNFAPNSRGPINLIPPSEVVLQLGNYAADEEGSFSTTVTLPNRSPVAEAQEVQTITRHNVGLPHLSRNGLDTWHKIVETVFLALLATSLATLLAVPISFLAARNIMKEVKEPVATVALSLMAWPLGIFLGAKLGQWMGQVSALFTTNAPLTIAGLVAMPVVLLGALRYAMPQEDRRSPSPTARLGRGLLLLAMAAVSILALFLLAHLAGAGGAALARVLGPFGFLGTFVMNLGEILGALIIIIVALVGGAIVSGWAAKLGQLLTEKTAEPTLKIINISLGALAGATLGLLVGALIHWFYQLDSPLQFVLITTAVGAGLGAIIVARYKAKEPLPIGLTIYFVVRTILNALRSIEAFIMAIIFVVLVTTGPFAGVLALTLHTIAALAKLYSEQVESIMPGPLEAVRATGANRLQTIIYAVIPQIIPPYISFTMYRWDINVRMSTIIGFAGGGGIGFLLQQNINLLNYRGAAAQILAIAIVVALMDYISSELRERVV